MMNGWYVLALLMFGVALVTTTLILFALELRLVKRIGGRTLTLILATDALLWCIAAAFSSI